MGTVKKIITVFALTIPLSFSATAFFSWIVLYTEPKLKVGDACGRSYQCHDIDKTAVCWNITGTYQLKIDKDID
jgi:hypothetical protein